MFSSLCPSRRPALLNIFLHLQPWPSTPKSRPNAPDHRHLVLAINGLSPSTLSSHWSARKCFWHFSRQTKSNINFPSFDLVAITCFIAYAHSAMGIKTHSIKVYLGCASFISGLLPGSLGPARGRPQITSPLRGLSRQEPAPNPRRLPLTLDLLSRCVRPQRPLRLEYPSHRRNPRTTFVLAFFSFLRRSEFTTLILCYDPHWRIWLLELSFLIN